MFDATPPPCQLCGKPIPPRSSNRGGQPKCCSPECRKEYYARRSAEKKLVERGEPYPTHCKGCGVELPPRERKRGAVRLWCSKNCQQRTVHVPAPKIEGACAQCGTAFQTHHSDKRFCSPFCREVAAGLRRPEPLSERKCALDDCDVVFVPMYGNQRCCCEAHGKKNWHREAAADGRKKREAWNDRLRDACHRRRALKAGASTGEPVRLAQIAERDRWTCYLCGAKVRKTVKWPDPSSPSLDHVVPLVDGGAHDPSNVRLTHLFCNLAKGRRGGGEQLMLIG